LNISFVRILDRKTDLRPPTATMNFDNVGPNLSGVSGDGVPRSGPGSLGGEPASIYISSNVSSIKMSCFAIAALRHSSGDLDREDRRLALLRTRDKRPYGGSATQEV
jgi:hypothetical protein